MVLCLDKLDQHIANAETTEETSVSRSADQLALNALNSSVFLRAKEKLFLILQWIISWLCVWNYLPTVKIRSSKNLGKLRISPQNSNISITFL